MRGNGETGEADRPGTDRAASAARALERLGDLVRRRLDRLENLARERAASGGREHELRKRIADLEAERSHFGGQIERFEQEHRAAAGHLDHDRKLLAEAWERLEREQVELSSSSSAVHGLPNANKAGGADRINPTNHRAPTICATDSSVEEAILKQFQALRRDVRRAASARRAQ